MTNDSNFSIALLRRRRALHELAQYGYEALRDQNLWGPEYLEQGLGASDGTSSIVIEGLE